MDGELWRLWQVLFVVAICFGKVPSGALAASDPNENVAPAFDVRYIESAISNETEQNPVSTEFNFQDSADVPGEPLNPTDYQNAQGIVGKS